MRTQGTLRMAATLIALAALCLTGCEDEDDIDHTPPPGQGTLVVDNKTAEDLAVFVDGRDVGEVRDGKDMAVDLRPGGIAVVLLIDDSDRGWRGYVDILEGRLAVLRVRGRDAFDSDLSVTLDYQD